MSRYRINIDNTPPSKAKIDAYKDFDALNRRYKVQSRYEFWRRLYRNPRYFAVLAALVSVSVLVYQSSLDQSPQTSSFISPPIPPKNIPPILQDGSLGDTLQYENGTKLYIPPGAFVDEQNQAVQGKIEIRYREFRDAADIFIAGIPMEYDSAQKTHTLESAAMLEVRAYAENKPVFLQEGKTLEVEYLSPVKGTDFSVYHLDTVQRNWQYEGKDLLRETQQEVSLPPKPELQYLLDLEADTFLTRNVAIPAQKPGKVFQVRVVNANDYRLLADKKQIVWEYLAMKDFPDPWEAGRLPNDKALARVKPYRAAGVFILEMKGGLSFVARPLLDVSSLSAAEVRYRQKLEEYERTLAEWKAQRAQAQEQLQAREAARKAYEEQLAAWEKTVEEQKRTSSQGVYRKFLIKHLGINQLGRIVKVPLMNVPLSFGTSEEPSFGKDLQQEGRKIRMIHPGINTVFTCRAVSGKEGTYQVYMDPARENLLLASDSEENLYHLTFRKIPEDQRLVFLKSQQKLNSFGDLKGLILSLIQEI